ncbi:MAG: putative hydro-lyase [Planctomycetaceae bacterium]
MDRLSTGESVRLACRNGDWNQQTSGLAPGFAQANLVILPRDQASDFLMFCQRNPKPCPLLDVTSPGQVEAAVTAPGSDLRTDLPGYRVWRHGEIVEEPDQIDHLWQDDLVSFLIGCSFTFESALLRAGLPVRHLEIGCNVPMFRTNRGCSPAGAFHGSLVVSMRPLTPQNAIRAVQVTSRYPGVHGAPVHLADPTAIGIRDLAQPDYGDPVPVRSGELPVFWACGVTPQAALVSSRTPFAITHRPGGMFVTDQLDESLAVA